MTDEPCIPDAPTDANPLEKVDVAVTKAVAPIAKTPIVRALGTASEISDQPQMRILCAGVIAAGLWRGDGKLARTGVAMLVAHSLATGIKTAIKHRVDRTRPNVLVDEGRYEMVAGSSHEHDETSFPSGHTAGAVAVAGAFAHAYPNGAALAYAAAAGVAVMQIPRCKHYPSDVGAGAVIGLLSAAGVNWAGDRVYVSDDPDGSDATR